MVHTGLRVIDLESIASGHDLVGQVGASRGKSGQVGASRGKSGQVGASDGRGMGEGFGLRGRCVRQERVYPEHLDFNRTTR